MPLPLRRAFARARRLLFLLPLLTACGDSPTSPSEAYLHGIGGDPRADQFSEALRTILSDFGVPIWTGNAPPRLEGTWRVAGRTFTGSTYADDPIGQGGYNPLDLTVTPGTGDRVHLRFALGSNGEGVVEVDGRITGTGDRFTFATIRPHDVLEVWSGRLEEDGIHDLRMAEVRLTDRPHQDLRRGDVRGMRHDGEVALPKP